MHGDTTNPPSFDGGFFSTYQPAPTAPWQPETPPPAATAARLAVAGPPPLVVAACAFLVLAGIAALWLGLTIFVVLHGVQGTSGPEGSAMAVRGAVLLVNGAGDLALPYLLLRGSQSARLGTATMCGAWVLYWLVQTSHVSKAVGSLSSSPFQSLGGLGTMTTLGLLLLAGWATVTALLLWAPGADDHFTRT